MTFWRVWGVALGALAATGILLVAVGMGDLLGGFMAFDVAHNLVHATLAAAAIAIGFGAPRPAQAHVAARAAGVFLVLLGSVGFASPGVFGLGDLVGLRFEVGENLFHLALGAWGLYVGFRG